MIMVVIDIKHVEDCFDGSLIKELLLSGEISKELIYTLGKGGSVQYFAHFAKPFFKIRVPGIYDLKGIQGNKTMRIHLKDPEKYSLNDFIELIAKIE
jgi:hypothetical protein